LVAIFKKAKMYFCKAAFFAEQAGKRFLSQNDLAAAAAWFKGAVHDYELAGEQQSWRDAALRLIELEHRIATTSLSEQRPWLFLRSVQECEKPCKALCWQSHSRLCETEITKLIQLAKDKRSEGNFYDAMKLFIVAAKLSKSISDSREKQCVAHIEECLQALQLISSAYLLLTYEEELNSYLKSFYESVGDQKRSFDHRQKQWFQP